MSFGQFFLFIGFFGLSLLAAAAAWQVWKERALVDWEGIAVAVTFAVASLVALLA